MRVRVRVLVHDSRRCDLHLRVLVVVDVDVHDHGDGDGDEDEDEDGDLHDHGDRDVYVHDFVLYESIWPVLPGPPSPCRKSWEISENVSHRL